ncbi:hypothetical protein V1499_06630 [Neobacillus sp. SCS-31]|uniref:hypothetical protein n=1 Tax=Neobacillus oceani TaxID=3115292 RepID=UPI003906746C
MRRFIPCILLVLFVLVGCSNSTETVKEEGNWEESAKLVREIVVSDDGQNGDFVFRIGDNGMFGF